MLFLTACSVSKSVKRNNTVKVNREGRNVDQTELMEQNITSNSFNIQKAEVEITDQGEKQRFFASVKYSKPDSFLITVRSTTGIEAVRIFSTKDTVLINDRINRIFFYGSREAVRKKYGLSSMLFPVLLGDLITSDKNGAAKHKCENGVINIDSYLDGNKVGYLINCESLKAMKITLTRELDTKPAFFTYSSFDIVSGITFAERLIISDLNNVDLIDVKFSKIQIPWKGYMVFVPGNNYERIEIK